MATYWASHIAAGGGAGTIGDPFTLQEGLDATTSADLLLVMATGTYTPAAKLDLDTNTGTVTARPTIRGAASDGTDDGTVATISGSGLPSSTTLLQIGAGRDYLRLENLRLTASKNYGLDSNSNGTVLQNVRIDNSASHGIFQQTISDFITLIDCEIDNNTGDGYTGGFSSRGSVIWIRGSCHSNGGFGTRLANGGNIDGTLIYKNTSHGVVVSLDNTIPILSITGATIASNGGNGIECISGTAVSNAIITNTILYENLYGLDLNGADIDLFTFRRLCAHNNTSGAISSGSLPADTVTDDPVFANEGAGTEDYTPSATALRIAVAPPSGIGGTSYRWIGAIQPNNAGGGGGAIGAGNLSGGFQ